MPERRHLFSDISWFGIIAGALAAMTSAWVASALGVAGTILGAALASLVVTVSSAMYTRTLDRSRELVVRTDLGTAIQRRTGADGQPEGDTIVSTAADSAPDDTTTLGATPDDSPTPGAPDEEQSLASRLAGLSWKPIIITTVIVLALAFAAMGAYEKITGDAYGTDSNNSRISNPFGSSTGSTDTPTNSEETDSPDDSEDSTDPTPTPTAETSKPDPRPSATKTTPAPTATPTPTATAPTPEE